MLEVDAAGLIWPVGFELVAPQVTRHLVLDFFEVLLRDVLTFTKDVISNLGVGFLVGLFRALDFTGVHLELIMALLASRCLVSEFHDFLDEGDLVKLATILLEDSANASVGRLVDG